MSRYTGSKSKVSRRFGEPIFGREKEIKRPNPPGQHGAKRKRKVSEYGQQLLEKQKAKYIYGMREGQFRIFFERAMAKKAKNFAEADRLRDELKAMGIEVVDTKEGATWKRV